MNRDKEDASSDAVANELEACGEFQPCKSQLKRLHLQQSTEHVWGRNQNQGDFCVLCGKWREGEL